MRVGDKVKVTFDSGVTSSNYGTIVTVNEFREPSRRYAVDLGREELLFFGKHNLEKVQEELNNE